MTLRSGLIGVCMILLALALLLFATGHGASGLVALAFEAGAVLVAVLAERFRYNKPLDAPPGDGWEPTGEAFVDPGSGETLRVYFHPASGKRVYLRFAPSSPAGG